MLHVQNWKWMIEAIKELWSQWSRHVRTSNIHHSWLSYRNTDRNPYRLQELVLLLYGNWEHILRGIDETCRGAQTQHPYTSSEDGRGRYAYNSSSNSQRGLLVVLRSEEGRILQCSQSLTSSTFVIYTIKVLTSNHSKLCASKDGIRIEISDFQLLL